MQPNENSNWLTVEQAFLLCIEAGLGRTKKTIRQWCRQGHVEAKKRITPKGETWMVDASSLDIKIQVELEFANSQNISATHSGADTFAPVQTGSLEYDPVRTRMNQSEHENSEEIALTREKISSMKVEIRSLEIDKGIRDRQIEFLEDENAKGREALNAQSRYIGHLETLALQAGVEPEAKFLSSPLPKYKSGADIPSGEIVPPISQKLRYNNQHENNGHSA